MACFAAVLSSVLTALAYPGPLGWCPVALIAGAPLYVAVQGQPLRRRLALGWFCGALTVALVAYWLPAAYQRVTGASELEAAGLQLAFCTWHGLDCALLVLIAAGLAAAGLPGSLSWALAHVAAELCLPRVLPYTYAVTLHAAPWALQSADLLGSSSIVFLLAGTHGGLGELWRRGTRFRQTVRHAPAVLGAWGLVWTAQLVYGGLAQRRLAALERRSPQLSVGIIQAGTSSFVKRDSPDTSLQDHLRLSRELLRRERPDVLIWGETAIATPLPASMLGASLLRRLGGGLGVPLLLGAVVREEKAGQQQQYNSVLSVAADGFVCPRCRYDKRRLLPWIEDTARNGARAFQAGNSSALLPVAGHEVGALVCFEAASEAAVRESMSSGDARWLVNLASDAWFDGSTEPAFHLVLAQLRAIEQRRFLVRATTTGISAVIAPDGNVIASAVSGEAAITGRISLLQGQTWYERWGNAPWWTVLGGCVLWAVRQAHLRRGHL
jgi:apolipoprotein N-acyltransferase